MVRYLNNNGNTLIIFSSDNGGNVPNSDNNITIKIILHQIDEIIH